MPIALTATIAILVLGLAIGRYLSVAACAAGTFAISLVVCGSWYFSAVDSLAAVLMLVCLAFLFQIGFFIGCALETEAELRRNLALA